MSLSAEAKQASGNSSPTKLSLSWDHDGTREEMPWSDKHDKLLGHWKTDCEHRSEYHGKQGKKFKKVFMLLGVPSIVLPLVSASVPPTIRLSPYIVLVISIIVALLTGTTTILNPGKKSAEHYMYESEFQTFVTTVNVIQSKSKRYREAADVTLEKVSAIYNQMIQAAPP